MPRDETLYKQIHTWVRLISRRGGFFDLFDFLYWLVIVTRGNVITIKIGNYLETNYMKHDRYLIPAHSVTISHAERLSRLPAERVQTV